MSSNEIFKEQVELAKSHLSKVEEIQKAAESVKAFDIAKKMKLAESAVEESVALSRAIVAALDVWVV
jgi:hypothetical protein